MVYVPKWLGFGLTREQDRMLREVTRRAVFFYKPRHMGETAMREERDQMARAMRHDWRLGRICEAGQHGACPGVGDPYDDEALESRRVFACTCLCHATLKAAADSFPVDDLRRLASSKPNDGPTIHLTTPKGWESRTRGEAARAEGEASSSSDHGATTEGSAS